MVRRDRYELLSFRVAKSTKKQYDRGMTAFLRFLEEVGDDDFTNVKDLEGYLLDFAVHTYYERERSGRQLVINAMLAVELYFPNLRGRFTDLRASLEGWAKQVPPMPRHVISELVAFGLAVELLRKSRADMATAILTAFECYLRSGDMENAKCEDYIHLDVPQGPRGSYYGILSLPKTKREQNESVYVRDPLVAELLRRQREIRSKRGKKPKNTLFNFCMATIRKQMKIILAGFGIHFTNTALHGLSNGGATTDDLLGRLTRDEIQQRGRWASAKSMRQYLQPDKMHLQVKNLPDKIRTKLKRRMARRFEIFNVTPPPEARDGGDQPRRGLVHQA